MLWQVTPLLDDMCLTLFLYYARLLDTADTTLLLRNVKFNKTGSAQ